MSEQAEDGVTHEESMTGATDVVADIDAVVEPVRGGLVAVASLAVSLRGSGTFGVEYAESMAGQLEPLCVGVLGGSAPLIDGVGLVWSSRSEAGADDSGMLWWRAEGGRIARKQHVFNPDSDSYYNYLGSQWFAAARDGDGDGLAMVGPFIDAWGTDDHTITASMRVAPDGVFVGVAAADLNVVAVTDALAAALRRHGDVVLVDPEDRVVASNHALLSPGLLLEPFLRRSGLSVAWRVATTVNGWFVVALSRD